MFPKLSPTGGIQGFCLPSTGHECYDLNGASAATPPGMAAAVTPSTGWNGPAFVLGPRVYLADWNNVVSTATTRAPTRRA